MRFVSGRGLTFSEFAGTFFVGVVIVVNGERAW